jgi:hypothetical protein
MIESVRMNCFGGGPGLCHRLLQSVISNNEHQGRRNLVLVAKHAQPWLMPNLDYCSSATSHLSRFQVPAICSMLKVKGNERNGYDFNRPPASVIAQQRTASLDLQATLPSTIHTPNHSKRPQSFYHVQNIEGILPCRRIQHVLRGSPTIRKRLLKIR